MSKNVSLFEKVSAQAVARKARKTQEIPQEGLERVMLFHAALEPLKAEAQNVDRKLCYQSTDGLTRWDRQTAQTIAARIKALSKSQGSPIETKAAPMGRDEAGNVLYGVMGWIPRQRVSTGISVTL